MKIVRTLSPNLLFLTTLILTRNRLSKLLVGCCTRTATMSWAKDQLILNRSSMRLGWVEPADSSLPESCTRSSSKWSAVEGRWPPRRSRCWSRSRAKWTILKLQTTSGWARCRWYPARGLRLLETEELCSQPRAHWVIGLRSEYSRRMGHETLYTRIWNSHQRLPETSLSIPCSTQPRILKKLLDRLRGQQPLMALCTQETAETSRSPTLQRVVPDQRFQQAGLFKRSQTCWVSSWEGKTKAQESTKPKLSLHRWIQMRSIASWCRTKKASLTVSRVTPLPFQLLLRELQLLRWAPEQSTSASIRKQSSASKMPSLSEGTAATSSDQTSSSQWKAAHPLYHKSRCKDLNKA